MFSIIASVCRQCSLKTGTTSSILSRQFSSTAIACARQKKPVSLSKKALAAKARKRALKSRKDFYANEAMHLSDAIRVLRAVEAAKPNSTYELVIKTAMPRGSSIPKGRFNFSGSFKPKTEDRILVFAEGLHADEARKAGAHIVGGAELIDGIVSGRHQATIFLCTPALLRDITPKLGRVLGPRGLMPSTRRGTVTEDFTGFIKRLSGTTEWKGDTSGTIRTPIAKMHNPPEDVEKNVRQFVLAVKRATGNQKESDQKNQPVNAVTKILLSSTQAPSIRISDL